MTTKSGAQTRALNAEAKNKAVIEPFGQTRDGRPVQRVKISNGVLNANILTYGATLQDLRLDETGCPLVLGWSGLEGYLDSQAYFGGIVGRCANRLANGHYIVEGQVYRADQNFLGRHTLHGGAEGTDKLVWQIIDAQTDQVRLALTLPDGHMGFAGLLEVQATYSIEPPASLRLILSAQSHQTTLCNFAPHFYFNLDGSETICAHSLEIDADAYLPVDDNLIPTGEVRRVDQTDYDFRRSRVIGTQAIDHNFCLSQERKTIRQVAKLASQDGSVSMVLSSTQPGLQIYSGALLSEGERVGLQQKPYERFAGIAMEPQGWPDAPNHSNFPSVVLQAGGNYVHETTYSFSLTY